MKLVITISTLFLIACTIELSAQENDNAIQKANDLYKQQQYQQAEAAYSEVLEKESSNSTAKYNRALALHKQGKLDEAIKELDDLAFKTNDTELKSKAYYNKGAILSGQKKLEESIEAYKNTLRLNPNDKEARENLQKALLELKKKDPPKKDDKKKQQQKKQQGKISQFPIRLTIGKRFRYMM